MTELLTLPNIVLVVGLLGIVFTIYNYFRTPQVESEKVETVLSLKFEQLQADFSNLRDNHIHTLENNLEDANKGIIRLSLEVNKLATIIDERIPRKIL